jgi:hypothetical protein
LAGGVDEATAVQLADEAVLSSQGGGNTKDLAGVQRNLPFLTQFYSYFSTTLNLVAEKTALTDFKNPRAVAGWLGDMALLAVIPAILPALITYLLKGGGEDDEPEDWAKQAIALYDTWGADRIVAEVETEFGAGSAIAKKLRQGLPVIKNRKTKQPTCNAEALGKLAEKFPLIKPLTDLIEEKRSLGVFLSTFCMMPLDTDGRMRCSYNVAGTETFRLSSSENAFGSGGNLQNVPKGEEE